MPGVIGIRLIGMQPACQVDERHNPLIKHNALLARLLPAASHDGARRHLVTIHGMPSIACHCGMELAGPPPCQTNAVGYAWS